MASISIRVDLGQSRMTDAEFQTRRLRVRRWQDADLDALNAVYGDADAMRWVGEGRPITTEECLQWFEVTRGNYARRGYGMFALESLGSLDGGSVIGFAGLVHPGGQPEAEIKYALHRAHWGKGLASELVPHLLEYGARTHGLEYIIATVAPGNLASQRVLTKAGMTLARQRANADGSTTLVFEWHAPGAL
jgi:[ribosomal protein S5]-alanine N-acetyltransferase